jgi:hypothetical protein
VESGVVTARVLANDAEHVVLADGSAILLARNRFCLPDLPAGTVVTVWYTLVDGRNVAEVIRVKPAGAGGRIDG